MKPDKAVLKVLPKVLLHELWMESAAADDCRLAHDANIRNFPPETHRHSRNGSIKVRTREALRNTWKVRAYRSQNADGRGNGTRRV